MVYSYPYSIVHHVRKKLVGFHFYYLVKIRLDKIIYVDLQPKILNMNLAKQLVKNRFGDLPGLFKNVSVIKKKKKKGKRRAQFR